MAGVVFGMAGVMNTKRWPGCQTGKTDKTGWGGWEIRKTLADIFGTLPMHWRKLIVPIQARSAAGAYDVAIMTAEDRLSIRSLAEVGAETTVSPYAQEVDPEAENLTLPVYTDDASRIKGFFNGTGSPCPWFLRSPYNTASNNYCRSITAAGKATMASASEGVSWICCMGGRTK